MVLDLTLDVLVGDIPGRQDTALKLFRLLLQWVQVYHHDYTLRSTLDRAIRFCFHLLEEDPDTMGEVQIRSRNLALLIHFIVHTPCNRDARVSFTAAQFDLLMDYHLHICEGTDYNLIKDTFWMLKRCLPNNPERMRRYIDTIIRLMGKETTCITALDAAFTIRVEIVSMSQDDESLQKDFSKALASAALLNLDDSSSFLSLTSCRDINYLQLLCTLAQDPTWHLQLHQDGHFDNCLAIAKTLLSSHNDALFQVRNCAAHVAHIFAIIDALGDEAQPLFNTIRAYPRRPLVLQAWKCIFDNDFFQWPTQTNWIALSREGYLDSLPSLVAYARKQPNDDDEPLIVLVEQVCRKLDEEKPQHEQGDTQHVHDLRCEEISALGNQIHALLQTDAFSALYVFHTPILIIILY